MSDDLVATVNAMIGEIVPALAKLGIELVELEEGRAVCRLPLEGNSNHFGAMYAGSLFCAGESLAGAIMFPMFDFTKVYPLVKNLTIDFLAPATTDVTAVAEVEVDYLRQMQAEVEATGKATWRHEVTLADANRTVVATMTGEGQVRRA